jgi:hypothetical protein
MRENVDMWRGREQGTRHHAAHRLRKIKDRPPKSAKHAKIAK